MRLSPVVILPLIIIVCSCQKAVPPPCNTAAATDDRRGNAGCLIVRDNHLLALRHRFGGTWGIPGGGSENNESAQCTAHRETWEEIGLDVTVGEHLHRFDNDFSLYRCRIDATNGQPIKSNDPWEISAVEWIDPSALNNDDWRFPDQFTVIQQLVRDHTDNQPIRTGDS